MGHPSPDPHAFPPAEEPPAPRVPHPAPPPLPSSGAPPSGENPSGAPHPSALPSDLPSDRLGGQGLRKLLAGLTAVRDGDLSARLLPGGADGVPGEIAAVYNGMADRLSLIASEVTRAAREAGGEDRARAGGVPDVWQRLTESVDELAGDLARRIRADEEQDWLTTHLSRVSSLTRDAGSLPAVAELVMNEVPPLVRAEYGGFFLAHDGDRGPELIMTAAYGSPDDPDAGPRRFRFGQSLVGQAARGRRAIAVDDLPPGYAAIASGTGATDPTALLILPVVVEDRVLGVVELAALRPFTRVHRDFLDRFIETVGAHAASLAAARRADELLERSRRLTAEAGARSRELRARQEELRRSEAAHREQAALLADRDRDIERKDLEIDRVRQELEERARQLSRTSLYKSEFLAHMSQELRTPLNSLLILAQLLAQNVEGNLSPKQVDYAEVIHSAGSDLLQLINDLLDLSKAEAGRMDVHPEGFALRELLAHVEAAFRPVAREQELEFLVTAAPDVPERLTADEPRLRQVLRHLLSNALKFTDSGRVELRVENAAPDEIPAALREAGPVLAFRITDTGIGIPADRLQAVFGAFQQGDAVTSRRYGGTGLGLSISREVAHLLGGAVTARSTPGEGSRFTLHLPVRAPEGHRPETPAPDSDSVEPARRRGAAEHARTGGPADDTAAGAADDAGTASGGRTVLVLEDGARDVSALTETLEREGMTVLRAAGGQEGIDLLRAHGGVDLIVLDPMTAGTDGTARTDGIATMAAIRGLPRYAEVPIIVVTAEAMPGDRSRTLAAGAHAHVAEPVDTADLLAKIRAHLPHR
ncbi:ATP-binding protein [Streptomyces sp. NPDC020141]|uniref:ATP-binding protein n=1 Tax=Streptomyces sp. NPDC020141 TaxID=3365065 RepID=UPI0037B28522